MGTHMMKSLALLSVCCLLHLTSTLGFRLTIGSGRSDLRSRSNISLNSEVKNPDFSKIDAFGDGSEIGVYVPSAMKAITDETFEQEVLANDRLNLVFFTSSWCAPCMKMMAMLTTEIMCKHGSKADFFLCDTDSNPEVTSEYSIRSIPSMLFIKDSKVVCEIIGAADDSSIVSDQIVKFF